MSKLRADSAIAKLTPEQREKLDRWIFVDNISYISAAARVSKEFGVHVRDYQVNKYHEREQSRFLREKIMRSASTANHELEQVAGDRKEYYKALLNMLGQVVFERVLNSQKQEDMQEVRDSLRVLIASKQEGHNADRVALQREKWEFDVSRVCVAHLAELQAIIANNSLDEHARLQAIRRRLFGDNLPE